MRKRIEKRKLINKPWNFFNFCWKPLTEQTYAEMDRKKRKSMNKHRNLKPKTRKPKKNGKRSKIFGNPSTYLNFWGICDYSWIMTEIPQKFPCWGSWGVSIEPVFLESNCFEQLYLHRGSTVCKRSIKIRVTHWC